MRKSTLLFAAIAVSTSCMAAVPDDFEVEKPKFHRYIKTNSATGINIRKSPSTSAPRALYKNTNTEIDYIEPYQYRSYWSTAKTGGSVNAVTFDEYNPVPLVSETDGWYEGYGLGPLSNGIFQNGWVSAKYCSVADMEPITRQMFDDSPYSFKRLDGDKVIFSVRDPEEGIYCFYIGKLCDGQLVCPYSLQVEYLAATQGKTYFKKTVNNGIEMYCSPSETDSDGFVLKNFTPETIEQILRNAEKMPYPFTLWSDEITFHCYQPTLPTGIFMNDRR